MFVSARGPRRVPSPSLGAAARAEKLWAAGAVAARRENGCGAGRAPVCALSFLKEQPPRFLGPARARSVVFDRASRCAVVDRYEAPLRTGEPVPIHVCEPCAQPIQITSAPRDHPCSNWTAMKTAKTALDLASVFRWSPGNLEE